MKSLILFLTLLITGPFLMAQQSPAVFLEPSEDDNDFGVTDPEITRTAAAGCEIDDASLFIMAWDGEAPSFGWDYDHGDLTGYQELEIGEPVNHPDVVVENVNGLVLAYIVYEYGKIIWFEIWQYDMGSNSWSIYEGPEEIGDGIKPNVDRSPEEELAVVWECTDGQYVYGVTGDIYGGLNSVENVVDLSCPDLSHVDEVRNPDVAINVYDDQRHILVVFRKLYLDAEGEETYVFHYPYNDFIYSSHDYVGHMDYGTAILGSVGPPRIAAPHYSANRIEASQVVQVEQTTSGHYVVHGAHFNCYEHPDPSQSTCPSNPNQYGVYERSSELNAHEYYSELDGNIYDPQEEETIGPVVSFYEDIHVAWAYKAPETGNFVIVYRRLDAQTGEVRPTFPYPNYDYSYSLVNGVDYSWETGDQHLPCIASRYSHANEKIIGWFNTDQWDDPRPEYKITHTNEIFFDLSVEADAGMVYPNPVFDQLRYDLTDKEASMIRLYSYDGRKVLSHHVSNESGSIDVSSLPAGMYIAEIILPNRIKRKKIVKI